MVLHLAEIAIVADMITAPVFIDVGVAHRLAADFFQERKCFEDGAGIVFAATEVVDLRDARSLEKGVHEPGDVLRMNIVTYLLALATEDPVFLAFEVALDEVTEEAVQLHAAMIGPGQASAAQAASGQTTYWQAKFGNLLAKKSMQFDQEIDGIRLFVRRDLPQSN
jgi:hypothetical protein